MATLKYRISFHSDWHTGSGLSSGSDVDALVIKDQDNLPYVPGKTIKGLLKNAALDLFELRSEKPAESDFINEVFGFFDGKEKHESKTHTKADAFFTNAYLSDELREKTRNYKLQQHFYRDLASTAIDEDGIAKDGSLRRIEVTIPCTLTGEIYHVDEKFENDISNCMRMVKQLGLNRNRGFGRCTIELLKKED